MIRGKGFEDGGDMRTGSPRQRATLLVLTVLLGLACQPGDLEQDFTRSLDTQRAALVGPVAGSVPQGLPSRLLVGLFEDTGRTWMRDSAVPWDVRYRYFIKGWVNNFGWGPADGYWGLQYMRECAAQGFIPAIQYYQMNNEPGGGEEAFLSKVQNTSTMRSYFSDFRTLMRRVKEFGRPVLILIEADGFGLLQRQTRSQPNTYAAVAATGLPELAGLPNTVAGWGQAFLQLRKAASASNAILGIHVSGWASGKDLFHASITDPLQPEVDSVYAFLQPLGLGLNPTGATYEVLVTDPLDRDADYYTLVLGQNRWWDPSDSASIFSKSFNRHAEWLRLWNLTAGKRWVVWQIPLGNSNHLGVANVRDAPREGYKDNRAEYFFGPNGLEHLEKYASSGVLALLFGRGEQVQSSYTNDYYTDGQLFMKSRAGGFLRGGGLSIPPGPSSEPSLPPSPQLPRFSTSAELSASVVAPGSSVDITLTVTATGGPVSDAIVNIEVIDESGREVGRKVFSGQSFFFNQSASYLYTWQVPTAGTYTVKAGVFGAGWAPTYHWNDSAATLRTNSSAPVGDTAPYNFESDAQGWTPGRGLVTRANTSPGQAWAGSRSLAVMLRGAWGGSGSVHVASPPVPAGHTLSVRVWVPVQSRITGLQLSVQQGPAGGWRWTGQWFSKSSLTAGAWNTLSLQVPADAAVPLHNLSVEFFTDGAWSGTCYLDSVSW